MSAKKDLTGQRFGRLTVLREATERVNGCVCWVCLCDCGEMVDVSGSLLRQGKTKSCGCFHDELSATRMKDFERDGAKNPSYSHGNANTRIYRIYKGMKNRCYNSKTPDYVRYGGRGIRICEDWMSDFMLFYKWSIENGYRDDLTIDRIDPDGNYEPSNCRWIPKSEQSKNRRPRQEWNMAKNK